MECNEKAATTDNNNNNKNDDDDYQRLIFWVCKNVLPCPLDDDAVQNDVRKGGDIFFYY